MKRNDHSRSLAYEQLESKAAPSSMLMVVPGATPVTEFAAITVRVIVAEPSPASYPSYATDQILRFVAENATGGQRAHRVATPPTAAQCAAADEMMQMTPAQWNSFLVLGFYDDGTEL